MQRTLPPSMYTNGAVTFRNPFDNSGTSFDPHHLSQDSPYAAYVHLNRPPTPPPEMHGAQYTFEQGFRQERGHDSVLGDQYVYKPYTSQEHDHARPPSPANLSRPAVDFESTTETVSRRPSQANDIAKPFQIPRSVNDSGGSLAELAAEITCFFWFESSDLLQSIEDTPVQLTPARPLAKDASPTTGFRKWVTTILSTTLVGPNVVLLALLFIHRLKKLNPSVKGKPGSEYRLLTVALMLGNKFLDDNTYTNKTWAEVSGINVSEVHIMEVEFLSNMKYCLYTSAEDWTRWQSLIGRYAAFFERATTTGAIPAPILPPASSLRMPLALPSPPASTQASPPYATDFIGSFIHGPTPAQSPLALAPVINNPRKRSLDDHQSEPPAKRISTYGIDMRLPAPVSQAPHMAVQPLPPFPVPTRAMGLVYPSTTSSAPLYATSQLQPVPQLLPQFQQAQQHSPYTATTGSSPAASIRTPVKSMIPHTNASPSVFLHQRSSPYRPVHNVSTLLYPPPTAALHQRQQNIEQSQMHYQPLAKQAQLHSGRLPYIGQNGWLDQTSLAPLRGPIPPVYPQRHPLSQ
ncbi:hypothetical protein AMS68_000812 [Peltaster fructicola]|uniref:Cyclin N-terminal domain-containing protein n=1 Tax=Peltaster fructicola TaxID=286661 RepID=A0A6H0XKZ5_9PEZI|nr:hypothetical protein AMS68_000812 [Peltaster fructicola]